MITRSDFVSIIGRRDLRSRHLENPGQSDSSFLEKSAMDDGHHTRRDYLEEKCIQPACSTATCVNGHPSSRAGRTGGSSDERE